MTHLLAGDGQQLLLPQRGVGKRAGGDDHVGGVGRVQVLDHQRVLDRGGHLEQLSELDARIDPARAVHDEVTLGAADGG